MIDPDAVLAAIDAIPPDRPDQERGYMGASEIGHPCDMYLWLKFHRYIDREEFDPSEIDTDDPQELKQEATKARLRRLFKRGHDEELVFEGHLHNLGATFHSGALDQAGFTDGFFAGHMDGDISIFDEDAISEYKTHNRKSFNTLKRGELERTHPKHFAQVQTYMKYKGRKQALYLAVCKDDDRIFCDVVEFDKEKANAYSNRAEFLTMSDKPPSRISEKPTFYMCKMCSGKDICHGFTIPRVNCRNCTSATKHREYGTFGCEMKQQSNYPNDRNSNNQLDESGSCAHHSANPYAMHELLGWEPLEFFPSQRAVKYKKPDGTELINGFDFVQSKDLEL